MSRFPTPGHLVSWAKLTPRTIQSGAKSRDGKTGKGNPYLKGLLGEAAAAAARTDTFLGERCRRLVKRRGKLKALVAVARTILVIIWHLLTSRTARFCELGPRLLRQPHRQSQENSRPHPPTGSTQILRHPRPCRLTSTIDEPGFTGAPPGAARCSPGVRDFRLACHSTRSGAVRHGQQRPVEHAGQAR